MIHNTRLHSYCLILVSTFVLMCLLMVSVSYAQEDSSVGPAIEFATTEATESVFVTDNPRQGPNPAGALLRSFVLPGWGQYYADKSDWRRGQYHLGADLALIGTWVYLHGNANMLQSNMYSHASAYAGINLRNVPLNIEIAVGSSNNIYEFNDTQLRSRNWDRLIDDIPENRWNWTTEDRRGEYLRMRDRRDRAEQQIPAIVSMMVVNRVISGVHAFIVARNQSGLLQDTSIGLSLPEVSNGQGFQASLQYRF